MFKSGDTVRLDPMADYISIVLQDGLSIEKTYVVEDVDTGLVPHDEETGQPEYEHSAVRLQGDPPDKWYDASWFVPA